MLLFINWWIFYSIHLKCIIRKRHFDPLSIPMTWSLGIARKYAYSIHTGLVENCFTKKLSKNVILRGFKLRSFTLKQIIPNWKASHKHWTVKESCNSHFHENSPTQLQISLKISRTGKGIRSIFLSLFADVINWFK